MAFPRAPSASSRNSISEAAGLNSQLKSLYEQLERRTAAQTDECESLREQNLDLRSANLDLEREIDNLRHAQDDTIASHKQQMDRCRQHVAEFRMWPDEEEIMDQSGYKTTAEYIDGLNAKIDEMRRGRERLSEQVARLVEDLGKEKEKVRSLKSKQQGQGRVKTAVDALEVEESKLIGKVSTLEIEKQALTAKVSALETANQDLTTAASHVDLDTASKTAHIEGLKTENSDLECTISALESSNLTLQSNISSLESEKQILTRSVQDRNVAQTSLVQKNTALTTCFHNLSRSTVPHLFALVVRLHMQVQKFPSKDLEDVFRGVCGGIKRAHWGVRQNHGGKEGGEGDGEEDKDYVPKWLLEPGPPPESMPDNVKMEWVKSVEGVAEFVREAEEQEEEGLWRLRSEDAVSEALKWIELR
jgi:hypothetical protein